MDQVFSFSTELIKRNIDRGEFGLERESLRVDSEGFLSHTKHPFQENPGITRDFCENQVELITDVFDNADDVLQDLGKLQSQVVQTLHGLEEGREYLWPFSNPPYVKGESDIPVAQFQGEQKQKTEYRNYLAKKYGKRKMLFSGIHFNYSFSDEMIKDSYREVVSGAKKALRQPPGRASKREMPYQEYKNRVYLDLEKKVTRYSWLIVYLTAASPVTDDSFLQTGEEPQYASVRCGEQGYWNDFVPVFDYANLETYIQSIEELIRSGQLKAASELYYPVRLKPKGENSLEHLRDRGINHIELRMLDVNPLSPIGIMKEDVEFLHYFLLYLASQDEITLTEEEQRDAIRNEKRGAEFDDTRVMIKEPDGSYRPIRQAALLVLQDMEDFYGKLGETTVLRTIQYQKDKLVIPENRYADRIWHSYGTDYVKRGLRLAGEYEERLLKYRNAKESRQT
jgi:glutamate--cysteine ligase